MGRRPDPPGLQAAKGHPGKREKTVKARLADARRVAKLLADAPADGADKLAPPRFLDERFPAALQVWRQLAPKLKETHRLPQQHRLTFALFCVYFAEWVADGVGASVGLTGEALKKAYEDGAAAAHESTASAKEQALALAETGKIGSAAIGQMIPLIKDYAELTGGDAKRATELLGSAMSGNAEAIVEINDKLHLWNASQQDHLVALARENDLTQLQADLLRELPGALDNAKPKLDAWTAFVNKLADAWNNVVTAQREANQIPARALNYGLNYTDSGPTPAEVAAVVRRDAAAAANSRSTAASGFYTDQHPEIAARQAAQKAINAVNARLGDVGGANAPGAAEVEQLRQSLDAYTHARDTATSAEQKAHDVALAQDALAKARTKDEKAAAQQALVYAQAEGEVVTKATLAQRAADAGRTAGDRFHPKAKPVDQTATFDAAVQRQIADADQQVAQAARTELQARLQLAGSADERFAIQRQIDQQDYDKQIAASQKRIAGVDAQIAAIKKAGLDTNAGQQIADLKAVKAKYQSAELDIEYTEVQKRINANSQSLADATARQMDAKNLDLQAQEQALQLQASLSRSTYAQTAIEEKILDLKLQELDNEQKKLDAENITVEERAKAQQLLDLQRGQVEAAKKLNAQNLTLINAVTEAADATGSFKDAIGRHNWADAFNSLMATIETVRQAFATQGLSGGLMTAGSAVGSLVGGKTGKAISTGVGIASLGASLGTAAGSLGSALALGGSLSSLGTLGIGSALTTIAPMLGPIGIGVGIIAGLASAFLGSKPSNHAAIATLSDNSYGLVSSGKETSDTTSAVSSAAGAILQGEAAIKAAGITLTESITKLDLGTRDMTHIFTSTGEELRSAVGDPAAAAETALKALLKSATYTDDAEKKLVDSMLAAGKGFDDISAALQAYTAAQQVSGSLADQILQLTDPEAYDKKQVTDAIKAQRDSLEAAAEQGYYTADQLAGLNAQLDQLQKLQLDQVLAKYAEAAGSATGVLTQAQQDAANDVSAAQSALSAAYDAQAQTINATISTFSQLASSLHSFGDSLAAQASASGSPQDALANAAAAFNAVAGKTDQESLAKLQDVAQAYLDAGKAGASSKAQYDQIQAQVRAAVSQGAASADAQVSYAQAQLDALNAQVQGLGIINDSVLSVADAIAGLKAALGVQSTLSSTGAGAAPANDNAIDVAKYLADNPDLVANWNAGGSMTTWGANLAAAALYHYQTYGKGEIAAGLRKFATGGSFRIGGMGATDSAVAAFRMTPGTETAYVTHGDTMARVAERLDSIDGVMRAGFAQVALNTGTSARLQKRWDGDGLPATRDVA